MFVTGIEGAASLNTVSVLDALTKSNAAWRFLREPNAPDLFEAIAVGTSAGPIRFTNGVELHPSVIADAAETPDLVVVPGLDDNVRPSIDHNRHWVPWLERWANDGAIVASSCTGAFLLAEAALLDGRRATTHWVAEGLFRATYPRVRLEIDQIVVDEGNVITSGGATTALNLVHYLVARFGSADRARAATQMMLLDTGRDSQLPFAMIGVHRNHNDALIHNAQSAIQQGAIEPLSVAGVAAHIGVSTRTLHRRFQASVGISPRAYLNVVRVESAKRLLEQTSRSVDRIRAEVGFADPTSFRRVFRQLVGATPSEYRRRFGRNDHVANG